jgi:hypothetical protein
MYTPASLGDLDEPWRSRGEKRRDVRLLEGDDVTFRQSIVIHSPTLNENPIEISARRIENGLDERMLLSLSSTTTMDYLHRCAVHQ